MLTWNKSKVKKIMGSITPIFAKHWYKYQSCPVVKRRMETILQTELDGIIRFEKTVPIRRVMVVRK